MNRHAIPIATAVLALVMSVTAIAVGTQEDTMPPEELPELSRQIRDLERRIERLEMAGRLPSASIGEGGLRVLDGGNVRVEGGQIIVTDADGNEAVVASAGALTVKADGGIVVEGGGDLQITGGGTLTLNGVPLEETNLRVETGIAIDSAVTTFPDDTTVVTDTIDVPSWASTVHVVATSNIFYQSPSTTASFSGRVFIDGDAGSVTFGHHHDGDKGSTTPLHAHTVSDPGATVDVWVVSNAEETGQTCQGRLSWVAIFA